MTDLNTLSDEALRLALARALERNAHLEGLVASIVERVKRLDRFTVEWMSAERYARLSYEDYVDEAAYLEAQAWVLEERETQEKGDVPYPYEHECPFFSERFLYGIFGKDDARTILAYFHQIQRLAEEDDNEMTRRHEKKERFQRSAKTIKYYEDRIRRMASILDPDMRGYKIPKGKDEAWVQEELRAAREGLCRCAGDLASETLWYFDDN